jgi:hypothetical protein
MVFREWLVTRRNDVASHVGKRTKLSYFWKFKD